MYMFAITLGSKFVAYLKAVSVWNGKRKMVFCKHYLIRSGCALSSSVPLRASFLPLRPLFHTRWSGNKGNIDDMKNVHEKYAGIILMNCAEVLHIRCLVVHVYMDTPCGTPSKCNYPMLWYQNEHVLLYRSIYNFVFLSCWDCLG